MQQQKRFLLKNIAADIDYFELYGGPNPSSLQLIKTNIVPDKFGFVSVSFNEYYRTQYRTYSWKVVDVLGNKSDFSLTNVLELDLSEVYSNFALQKIGPDVQPQYVITTNYSNDLGTLPQGFSRLRTSIQKQNNSYVNFSSTKVIYSNQTLNPIDHAAYIQVQPVNVGPNETIRIFWRCEAANQAIIERRKILPTISSWEQIYTPLFISNNLVTKSSFIQDYSPGVSGDKYEYRIISTNNNTGVITSSSFVNIINSNLPGISSFTSSDYNIEKGDSITLTWATNNADVVYLDNYYPTLLSSSGNISISPNESSDITLVAVNTTSGAVTESKIHINVISKPEIIAFKISNQNIFTNDSINIIWSASDCCLIELSDDGGLTWSTIFQNDKDTSNVDFIQKTPLSNTSYQLRIKNTKGVTVLSNILNVTVNNPPTINSFEILSDATYQVPGDVIEFSYNIDGVNLVTISGTDGTFFSTSNNPSPQNLVGTFITPPLVGSNYPIFEKNITYTINAIRNSVPSISLSQSKEIIIQTPRPIVENILLSNLSDITSISLSFDYAYSQSFKILILDSELESLPNEDNLIFNNSGPTLVSYSNSIDFSTIKNPTEWAQGETVKFNLWVNGANKETIIPITMSNSGYSIG